MVKQKHDELAYNTQKSLIKKNPILALKILGLGMTERVFNMITGNFEVSLNAETNFGNEGKLKKRIFMTPINTREIYSTERKKDNFFYTAETVAPLDTKADEVYEQRSTFFATVGHMLQMLRLRYKNVLLDGEYTDINRFKVSLVIPVKKGDKTDFYRIPVEFLNGDVFASDNEGIKIACYTPNEPSSKRIKKMEVMFSTNDNVVFAYYDPDCLKLPFYCTSKGEFKGESFFFSSLVTRLIQQQIKKSSPMTNEEMQSIYDDLGMNLDSEGRYYDVAKYNEKDDVLATINPKYAFAGVKNVLYSNFTVWFSFSEYMIAKHALKKHSMSSLQLADIASIKYDKCFGIYSYLIKRTNAVFDNETIQIRIKQELESEKQFEEISEVEEKSQEEIAEEDNNSVEIEKNNSDKKEDNLEEKNSDDKKDNLEEKNSDDEKDDLEEKDNVDKNEHEKKNDLLKEDSKKNESETGLDFINEFSGKEENTSEKENKSSNGFRNGLADF